VDAFIELLGEYSSGAERLASVRPRLKRDAMGLRMHLLRPEFRCPVFGITKAGKSTLINALLGQEILPVSNVPMTLRPLEVFHSPGAEVATLYCGMEKIQGQSEIRERLSRTRSQEQLAEEGAENLRLEVSMPFLEGLSLPGRLQFTILDTPGVTEAEGENLLRSTLQEIVAADAALFVMNSQELRTVGEQAFLAQCAKQRPDLFFLRAHRAFFYVLSKADPKHRTATPLAEVARLVQGQVRGALPRGAKFSPPRILPVQADLALLARVATTPDADEGSRADYTQFLFGVGCSVPHQAHYLRHYAPKSLLISGVPIVEQALRELAREMISVREDTMRFRLEHLVNRSLRAAEIHLATNLKDKLTQFKKRLKEWDRNNHPSRQGVEP